jgi:hypothetical protein
VRPRTGLYALYTEEKILRRRLNCDVQTIASHFTDSLPNVIEIILVRR